MRLQEIDRGGWARVAGAALLCALAASVFASSFPIGWPIDIVIGAGVGLAIAALIVGGWAGTGGYAANRALRDWVRGGPNRSGSRLGVGSAGCPGSSTGPGGTGGSPR
ncbi:hypothetical protein P9139_16620 [Curtobacterium flaccumfaciens]|nr:hypothetical protein P9139_16620 [Curtobacterium flaccumfaciens]